MRCIALLTDFGTRDPYVASMKGVLASRTDASLVDLTHDLAPFDVFAAAWFLRTAAPWWPVDTIFLAVIDPGVGSSRRIVAMENDGRMFLAPDNGLLTFVRRGATAMHAVENADLFLPESSNTFHGRDRFAPVAAALANGIAIDALGPRIEDIVLLDYEVPSYGDLIRGTIVAIDRFGNAITDIDASRISFAPFAMVVGSHVIDRLEPNYADAAPGPFLIIGSNGTLEISIANDNAAERLQLRRRERVEVRPYNRVPSSERRAPSE
jgi:S-adenosylmethionine hydrolase